MASVFRIEIRARHLRGGKRLDGSRLLLLSKRSRRRGAAKKDGGDAGGRDRRRWFGFVTNNRLEVGFATRHRLEIKGGRIGAVGEDGREEQRRNSRHN